jgi:hypothetical protein
MTATSTTRFERVRFDGHGCVVSQAAAMPAEYVEARATDEARRHTPDGLVRLFGGVPASARRRPGASSGGPFRNRPRKKSPMR